MNEHGPNMPERPRFNTIELRFGDVVRTFTTDDTVIRKFVKGDGVYDHCVYTTQDRKTIAFTPTPEAMQDMIDRGFHVHVDKTPDPATIEHFIGVQSAHIDDELDTLGL